MTTYHFVKIPTGLGRKIEKLAQLEKLTVEEAAVATLLTYVDCMLKWQPIDRGPNKGKRYRVALKKNTKAQAKRALRRAA